MYGPTKIVSKNKWMRKLCKHMQFRRENTENQKESRRKNVLPVR